MMEQREQVEFEITSFTAIHYAKVCVGTCNKVTKKWELLTDVTRTLTVAVLARYSPKNLDATNSPYHKDDGAVFFL